ncbi:tRNA pseudouridine(55) synthase TruB [Carnobacteriaceae bacterium zg-ZUI78]|nr:tRNA pseudouridine(55) synthase TruB [Carnobacteriaceae bacterium zg-ZUI78]
MNGILPLWKERGMTSHDCVFKLRKILKTKKVGHTGTLDPNVDGVLPICIGSATKMVEFMLNAEKQYEGEITLGIATSTEDSDGDIVAVKNIDKIPTTDEIDAIMASMLGRIQQIPPMYSAVKVNGKKLYEYARNHETVERPVRQVVIYDFKRISDVSVHDNHTVSWRFSVTCSKGTYVRTLAVDLGAKMGYPAFMSDLTRTQSAGFKQEQCFTLHQLEVLSDASTALIPVEQAFLDYPRCEIDDEVYARVQNGAVLQEMPHVQYPVFFVYRDKIIALYDKHPERAGYIKPKKMLLSNGEST